MWLGSSWKPGRAGHVTSGHGRRTLREALRARTTLRWQGNSNYDCLGFQCYRANLARACSSCHSVPSQLEAQAVSSWQPFMSPQPVCPLMGLGPPAASLHRLDWTLVQTPQLWRLGMRVLLLLSKCRRQISFFVLRATLLLSYRFSFVIL